MIFAAKKAFKKFKFFLKKYLPFHIPDILLGSALFLLAEINPIASILYFFMFIKTLRRLFPTQEERLSAMSFTLDFRLRLSLVISLITAFFALWLAFSNPVIKWVHPLITAGFALTGAIAGYFFGPKIRNKFVPGLALREYYYQQFLIVRKWVDSYLMVLQLEEGRETADLIDHLEDRDIALFQAVKFSCETAVRKLLAKGADFNYKYKNNSILSYAFKSALEKLQRNDEGLLTSLNIINLLLEKDIDLNDINDNRDTALHLAVRLESSGILQKVIEKSVELNKVNNHGDSALHVAVEIGSKDIAKKLMACGIDISLLNKLRQAALTSKLNHPDWRQIMVEHYSQLPPLGPLSLKAISAQAVRDRIRREPSYEDKVKQKAPAELLTYYQKTYPRERQENNMSKYYQTNLRPTAIEVAKWGMRNTP